VQTSDGRARHSWLLVRKVALILGDAASRAGVSGKTWGCYIAYLYEPLASEWCLQVVCVHDGDNECVKIVRGTISKGTRKAYHRETLVVKRRECEGEHVGYACDASGIYAQRFQRETKGGAERCQ
jgi:hypothetical protein